MLCIKRLKHLSVSPVITLATVACLLLLIPAVHAQSEFVNNGEAGFVVSHIEYALSHDAEQTGACPNGMVEGYSSIAEVFPGVPELQSMTDSQPGEGIRKAFELAASRPDVKNLCQNPELGKPHPDYHTVSADKVPVYGLDMDKHHTRANERAPANSCAHNDFVGMQGETGIDNQYYRVVGCQKAFQSTGQSNTFAIAMLTGSWGILITLSGVDDIRNDDSVDVGFYANADPIRLSPLREPIPYASYSPEQDPRYRASTRGRIVDGVLTTEPVDLRVHWVVNSMRIDRPLQRAVAELTLSTEGVLEGYLAGYAPVEGLYNFAYGFRNATDGAGELAPLRLRAGSSIGKAIVQGYTCEGVYHALYQHADGDPDPETGQCTSISTQYRIKAIPAFVVDVESKSINEDLDKAAHLDVSDSLYEN